MASIVGKTCPSSALAGLTYVQGDPLPAIGSGTPIVLEFWATWCPPCRQTIPHLTKLAHANPSVKFVGITSETDAGAIRAFVQRMGQQMDYPVALDTAGSAQQLMEMAGAHGIPHAFVVAGDGRISWSGHPADPGFAKALQDVGTAAAPAAMRELPLITETYEELMAMPARELKAILDERGISYKDCVEKGDFARKIVDTCSKVVYHAKA